MSETKPKPKPQPEPKYTWLLGPGPNPDIICCHGLDGQTLCPLWEADTLSSFHDKALAKATKEINAILERVARSKRRDDVELGFIEFQNRLLLVWSTYDAVSAYDDDEVIIKALGLKTSKAVRRKK